MLNEVITETKSRKFSTLQKNPVVLPKSHCVELDAISANIKGIAVNGCTKSEAAVLTIK
jgi:hypothetical protein